MSLQRTTRTTLGVPGLDAAQSARVMATADAPHVVVVGAGFAGLRAVRALSKAPVDVTLIDRHNFQTFQPLLYQVATAGLNVADVAFPIRGVIRRYKNCRFRRGVVASVDHDSHVVHLADGEAIGYDYLIIGGGARAAYFDVPGAEEHAFALYSLADATRLRNHILRCVEQADAHPELIEKGLLTFVVVGGGPTGVEMAGGLFEVCIGVLRMDFPALHDHTARVILIERLDVVLSAFHSKSQNYALEALRRRGVDVRYGETVAAVEQDALLLEGGERFATSTVIWAAGVQTEALAEALGAEPSLATFRAIGARMRRLRFTGPCAVLGVEVLATGVWRDFFAQKRHNGAVEAGVRELRDHLSRYLDVVRDGQEVTVTDHGKAVARLVPLDQPRAIDRLIADGLVTPARVTKRPRTARRIAAKGTVSDLVADQRQ